MRGAKKQNFWITEAIMGAQGHDVIGYLPRPKQAKMWSYQGIAHGPLQCCWWISTLPGTEKGQVSVVVCWEHGASWSTIWWICENKTSV